MVFIGVEDLYGTAEIIAFESAYQNSVDSIVNDNIVIVEGRLSIREDEEVKIVAYSIKTFSESKERVLILNIDNLDESKKKKLRGALKFFSGEKNNIKVKVKNNGELLNCGTIFLNNDIRCEIEDIVGIENVEIKDSENI